jgi:hypothetical protein
MAKYAANASCGYSAGIYDTKQGLIKKGIQHLVLDFNTMELVLRFNELLHRIFWSPFARDIMPCHQRGKLRIPYIISKQVRQCHDKIHGVARSRQVLKGGSR